MWITCRITEEHFRYRGNTLIGTGIPDKAIVMHNKEITKLATAKIDAAVVRSHAAFHETHTHTPVYECHTKTKYHRSVYM